MASHADLTARRMEGSALSSQNSIATVEIGKRWMLSRHRDLSASTFARQMGDAAAEGRGGAAVSTRVEMPLSQVNAKSSAHRTWRVSSSHDKK